MSFTAGTKVLLASGLAVPIASLKPGEKVIATNVKTGKTSPEPVTAVLVHHDTNRYDLTVKSAHGTAVIQTTSSHLFWDTTSHRWVKASALKYEDNLRTSGGATATVLGGYVPADTSGWMWDLTVPGGNDHDFYVDTAAAAVLVHNCDFPGPEARAKVPSEWVPSEWGDGQPNAKGIVQRWTDPGNPGNGIRIDQGNPDSPFPSQQVDHVVVRSGGQILGPDGVPIDGPLAANPAAHIPLSDWLGWALWNEP
jgi:Pretoxin HINT domain